MACNLDALQGQGMPADKRTHEQHLEHYVVEKELAQRLMSATREERRALYASVYDELFTRVPSHPQVTHVDTPEERRRMLARQFANLRDFITGETVYVEIGAGDCSLALEVAKIAKKVYALDVAETIAKQATIPANFELIITDGVSIPVPEPVDLVYSNQLMEHLHPDDADEQLRSIHAAMRKGANYFCITPNRLTGPHDISLVFDEVATGFHLKEYTCGELNELFRSVGFRRLRYYRRIRGVRIEFDSRLFVLAERMIGMLPKRIRRPLVQFAPVRLVLGSIQLVGTK